MKANNRRLTAHRLAYGTLAGVALLLAGVALVLALSESLYHGPRTLQQMTAVMPGVPIFPLARMAHNNALGQRLMAVPLLMLHGQGAKRAETAVLDAPGDHDFVVEWYRRMAPAQRWRRIGEETQGQLVRLLYLRGNEGLQLLIGPSNGLAAQVQYIYCDDMSGALTARMIATAPVPRPTPLPTPKAPPAPPIIPALPRIALAGPPSPQQNPTGLTKTTPIFGPPSPPTLPATPPPVNPTVPTTPLPANPTMTATPAPATTHPPVTLPPASPSPRPVVATKPSRHPRQRHPVDVSLPPERPTTSVPSDVPPTYDKPFLDVPVQKAPRNSEKYEMPGPDDMPPAAP